MQSAIAGLVIAVNLALAGGAVASEAAPAATAPPAAAAAAAPAAAPAPAPFYVPDAVIKQAISDVLHAEAAPVSAFKSGPEIYSGDPTSARMTAAFNQARVPDCLHDNALKHQPAHIGPIGVVGPLSLPWVISAVLRGKCSLP
ncbi:hypothetical protein ACFOLJ_09840 [Rugamonas sp. CCM 8940]|nr:hypothetical protein [Rugamonas sp. CCM 8940]